MSKITNDGLTRSGSGCFIAVPIATVGVKGLMIKFFIFHSKHHGDGDRIVKRRSTTSSDDRAQQKHKY